MREPLSFGQALELLKVYPLKDLIDQFEKMNNWKPLKDKNSSAYFTCNKWFKKDIAEGKYFLKHNPNQPGAEFKIEKRPQQDGSRKELFLSKFLGKCIKLGGDRYDIQDKENAVNMLSGEFITIAILITKIDIVFKAGVRIEIMTPEEIKELREKSDNNV